MHNLSRAVAQWQHSSLQKKLKVDLDEQYVYLQCKNNDSGDIKYRNDNIMWDKK